MGAERLCRWVVGGLAFAYLMSYPLAIGRADESHLLLEARRVFDGQIPYKDFFESLTPLSMYLFAGVYRIAGTNLLAARITISLIEAAAAVLLFQLARRVAGTLEAVVATLIFLCLCIPAWPFASPHWISTALDLLAARVMLSERWQGATRGRPFLAGLVAGAAFCTQQQRGVFLVLWLPVAASVLAVGLPRGMRVRAAAREIAWAAGGTILISGIVLGYAIWKSSFAGFADMVFWFAVRHYGPSVSVLQWALVIPGTNGWAAATWIWLLRVAPLLLAAEMLVLVGRFRRACERRDLERLSLCLLAVLMGLSIWYLRDFIHVSFVLPFFLFPAATLVHRVRSAALWSRLPAGRRIATAIVGLFGLAIAGQGVRNVAAARAAAPVRLETSFGALRVDASLEMLFHAVDRHLLHEPDGRAMLYSFPDDAWLYLALPADNVTPYSLLYFPMYPPEDFQQAIDALRAGRAGTVVLLPQVATGPKGPELVQAVEDGYDFVEEVNTYRIYVRRPAPPSS